MVITDEELAISAAEAGSAVVRARFGARLERVQKSPRDFATAADIEAERAIVERLRAARPRDAVLGEESGRTGADHTARVWLVDPLCGTLNYAVRSTLVAVNVALWSAAGVVVGASADPFADEVFWTAGEKAYVRRGGVDEELTPSAESGLVDVNLDPPFPGDPPFRAVRLLAEPGFAARFHPRVVSTSLAMTWVAAGRRAGYVSDGHARDSVHFASAVALCQAAGCVVSGLRGEPLRDGVPGLVAAADHETHAALLALIAKQFSAH